MKDHGLVHSNLLSNLVSNLLAQRFGYHDASCFGHALEGNLHLVFSQGFRCAGGDF